MPISFGIRAVVSGMVGKMEARVIEVEEKMSELTTKVSKLEGKFNSRFA